MLRVGRSKNYSHSYEFHQVFCPLNKHRRNKHNFVNIFKIQPFEVDINKNGISCNCYVKIYKLSWNKNSVFSTFLWIPPQHTENFTADT